MHVYGAAYGAGIIPAGQPPASKSSGDAFAELLAMETAKTETAAMRALFETGRAEAAQPQSKDPGELMQAPCEESAEPLPGSKHERPTVEQAAPAEDNEENEDEEAPALSFMTPVMIIQPQEMPEEPVIDTEVSGVAAPPALKVQEELRELIARITGLEDSGDFSVFIDKLLTGQPVTYQDMAAAKLTLAQLGASASEQDIAKLIEWLQDAGVRLPDLFGLELEAPAPQDLIAQLLTALNAETLIVTQTPETAEDAPGIKADAAPDLPPDTEPAQSEPIRPVSAGAAQAADTDEGAAVKPAEIKPPAPELAAPAPSPAASAVQTAEPVEPPPAADSADILRQLTEHISLQRGESVTKLEMTLNPATLGRISIVLEQTADGLTAALKPQNESVRSLLAAHATDLQNALKDLGIRMESVRIEQPDIGWDFARGQMEQQQREASPHGSRTRRLRTIPGAESGGGLNALTALMYGASALQPVSVGETSLDLRA